LVRPLKAYEPDCRCIPKESPCRFPPPTPLLSTPRRPPLSGEASAPIVDLTQLAVAQTNVKMTAAAGAALGQTTGELTGVLVNISA
jgi:hypothetical protein